ncbi:TetR/AcrR family transcriptional regulator, partial [Streptomyces sp. TRM76130]|nr:TetR/AcrR family transcriptional regulator [Streptomyces sp. TRM76130]
MKLVAAPVRLLGLGVQLGMLVVADVDVPVDGVHHDAARPNVVNFPNVVNLRPSHDAVKLDGYCSEDTEGAQKQNMPTSTRRARERASTRERIVQAALHVLETEGPAALTIRRIATDIEYSVPVVYQHFANKDALVLELVAHGHAMMLAEFRKASEEPDIDRRMMRMASDYVRFAGEHPHLYAVMNGTSIDAEARRL